MSEYTDHDCLKIENEAMYSEIKRLRAEIERLKAERKTLIENHEKHIIAVIEAWSGHG